jgi:AhpD family alkylhydroperoxidase
MTILCPREVELVVIGAAIASNCIKCVEHHILEARKIGLTEPEIRAVVKLADQVRAVPAAAVLQSATAAFTAPSKSADNFTSQSPTKQECTGGTCCC